MLWERLDQLGRVQNDESHLPWKIVAPPTARHRARLRSPSGWFTDASLTACYGEVGFPVSVQTLERKEWRDLDGGRHSDLVVIFSTREAQMTKAYMARCAEVRKAEGDERFAVRQGEKKAKDAEEIFRSAGRVAQAA